VVPPVGGAVVRRLRQSGAAGRRREMALRGGARNLVKARLVLSGLANAFAQSHLC